MTRFFGLLSLVALVLSVGALGGAYLVYRDYDGAFRAMSSDLAEMKVSLKLLSQRPAGAAIAEDTASADVPATGPDPHSAMMVDILNRLAILEEVWRHPSAAAAAGLGPGSTASTGPAATAGQVASSATDAGDCLPLNTRFLLTPGDSYAVCGTNAHLSLTAVSGGTALIEGAGTVPSGGMGAVAGTNCQLSVLSTMDEGSFAEVRVTC